jgi:uncharacterized protein YciI
MFIVTLRFADKARAPQFMDGHNDWLRRGFEEGVFLLAGGLDAGAGGAVIAHGVERETLEQRIAADPFVSEGLVVPEICEVTPGRTDARLAFLTAAA